MTRVTDHAVRHAWGERHPLYDIATGVSTTFRGCTRCGMCQAHRNEGRLHWCEYFRMPDGARVVMSGGATPPCGENQ